MTRTPREIRAHLDVTLIDRRIVADVKLEPDGDIILQMAPEEAESLLIALGGGDCWSPTVITRKRP